MPFAPAKTNAPWFPRRRPEASPRTCFILLSSWPARVKVVSRLSSYVDGGALPAFGRGPILPISEGFSLSRRRSSRLTLPERHFPPRGANTCRSFNSRMMAVTESKPAFRSVRIVEARALARASALRFCPRLLLVLPLPSVTRPRRVSILITAVRCHFPPRGDGIPHSFNSLAMALPVTTPAFRSLRIVGPTASARASATGLLFSSLLFLPKVSRSRRRSNLTTVFRCQLPPDGPGSLCGSIHSPVHVGKRTLPR